MDHASTYLATLGRRNALAYAELPQSRAILLTGSTVTGEADYYSDLDMIVYHDQLPSAAAMDQARVQNGGGERIWLLGTRESGVLIEAYYVYGVQCQVLHTTIAAWEQNIASVLEQLDVASPQQKAIAGVLAGTALYGEELIASWKEHLASYPEPLARAMVEHHLHFFPLWSVSDYLAQRDASVWSHQVAVEAAQNIVGILAGLNRVYHSAFQLKRVHALIAKFSIAPSELPERLERLFDRDIARAGQELEALVDETLSLVEAHMPAVDTSKARERIGARNQPWQPHPSITQSGLNR